MQNLTAPYWTDLGYVRTISNRLPGQQEYLSDGKEAPLILLKLAPDRPLHFASPPGFLSPVNLDILHQLIKIILETSPEKNAASAFLQYRGEENYQDLKGYLDKALSGLIFHIEERKRVRIDLTPPPNEMLQSCRKDTRARLRQVEREGFYAKQEHHPEFQNMYSAMAKRNNFSPIYEYTASDIEAIIQSSGIRSVSLYDKNDQYCGGSILGNVDGMECDYILSTYAPQITNSGRAVLWHSLNAAKTLGFHHINLGGGVSEQDDLYDFKMSFGGISMPFYTIKIVLNEQLYRTAYGITDGSLNLKERFPPQ